ncbi:emp24/gp25L/p24 family/GOLD-domain-containing protein [Butyriboletus roseoflavus]|nr:emp24/gp25L/p24 family/GOLD-domain-containing protein [Butyriboletus roseoflavus]
MLLNPYQLHCYADPCSPLSVSSHFHSSSSSSSYPFRPPSNSPSPQRKSRSKSAYGTQPTHTPSSLSPPTVGPGPSQRIDIEIIDSTPQRNVYLSKKDIKGETRLAVTAHAEGEIGVCFKNHLAPEVKMDIGRNITRTIDLDVDIGADAVDYNAIANQESLSALETEMRKLEGLVKEIADELDYLKKREERFTNTNLSTNRRVQNFAWFSLFSLVGLGVWQIFHLRAFFKRKYLID